MVKVNNEYIFNARSSVGEVTNEITGDHYDDGRLSDYVWDSYDFWSDLNGTKVTVISVHASKKMGSCDEWAKVFVTSEGFEYWFSAHTSELSVNGTSAALSSKSCTCDIAAIMVRGCRCGGS